MGDPTDEKSRPVVDRESEKEGKAQEDGNEHAGAVDIGALDTYTTLKLFLTILSGQAWRKMGLVVDPQTNKAEKDMEQARTAIDCFQFILKRIEGKLSEEEKGKLNTILSDLQLNFVTHQ
ncbi:MAG: DUF1844 domain-containing protein [Promethearchaeati archaeon SRVP18_Atabeyarchaeia-1]